jgi:hypothetical protein
MTNTVLDHAEQRAAEAATQGLFNRQAHIEELRDVIGLEHYQQAKIELPKFERFVNSEIRPWLDRLTRLRSKAKPALPAEMQKLVADIENLCITTPQTIRKGLEGWDRLQVPIWKDGKSVDQNQCRELVASLRSCLRNWDGMQGFIENCKARVERYISESGWPAAEPVGPRP